MYLRTHEGWTLTTPITRIGSGTLTDEVLDDGAFVVAGSDAAWLVEEGMLLPIHDGEILPVRRSWQWGTASKAR